MKQCANWRPSVGAGDPLFHYCVTITYYCIIITSLLHHYYNVHNEKYDA